MYVHLKWLRTSEFIFHAVNVAYESNASKLVLSTNMYSV